MHRNISIFLLIFDFVSLEISQFKLRKQLFKQALSEERILITTDKDFGYLVFKEKLATNGVILLRLKNESIENLTAAVINFLVSYQKGIYGKFVVISESRYKVKNIS